MGIVGNMGRLAGKTAAITGGASGIGRETVRRFVEEGVNRLYLIDRDGDRLRQVSAELGQQDRPIGAVQADLTNPDDCQKAIDHIVSEAGSIDVLVSNAGGARQSSFLNMPREQWDFEISLNLSSHFSICQSAARAMVEQKRGGVILCTVSTAAYGGVPMLAAYGAAKSGLMNLVKTMALELAPHNIRVNSVSPGATDTPGAAVHVDAATLEQMRKRLPVPLGRFARPSEIADGFVYLASNEASYITGFDLVIDGGSIQHAVSYGQISK